MNDTNEMNQKKTYTESGYLTVRVSTALGVIPLSDASVTVRGTDDRNRDTVYSLRTDSDGKTEKLTLPTPPKADSESPQGEFPFALYEVDVAKDGYLPLSVPSVPVFSGIHSIQPAILVPYPDGGSESDFPPTDGSFGGMSGASSADRI